MRIYSNTSRHLVAIDCVIFGYDIHEKEIKLLLVKRDVEPDRGKWSLSGGFVNDDESLDAAASRILYSLTGLKNVYMEQSYAYGDVFRDKGARVISVAYSALIKIQDINNQLKDSHGANWRSFSRLPELVFDHPQMVDRALVELKRQIKIKPLGFELLPDKFTLVQLQNLYEAIYQKKVDKRNFRKKILSMNLLQKFDEKEKETSKKGAYYYKFIPERYDSFKKSGFYFNLDVN